MHLPADTNWFHCKNFLEKASTNLVTLMSTFAKNKDIPVFQHLFLGIQHCQVALDVQWVKLQ